jgi:hypothetical protein
MACSQQLSSPAFAAMKGGPLRDGGDWIFDAFSSLAATQ